MASVNDAENFDESLGCLCSSALDDLAAQLRLVDIESEERSVIQASARESLLAALHEKLGRLLVLELNAARVTGRLNGADTFARWKQFLEISSSLSYWEDLATHYPTLLPRVRCIVRNRCRAALEFARHYGASKARLPSLCGHPLGQLTGVKFGAGDTHRQGRSVVIAHFSDSTLVYKPRSLGIDVALREFVAALDAQHERPLTIKVPRVLECGDHGWAEFVSHRYALDDAALRRFYRGIGHWLSIMRLLGGSDLHAENLIACDDAPVVVDCETLFTPRMPPHRSGYGDGFDHASRLITGSVLSVGLLPGRGLALGWRGVDSSALGLLQGEQPMLPQPTIIGMGTDEARVGSELIAVPMALNHPSPHPALARYWPDVLDGFDELTATLSRMDGAGVLRPALERFAECEVRYVPRATESYSEVARMLWHPVSLHQHEPSIERARQLLEKMARNVSSAPAQPEIIQAEIEDLLEGDVPYFSATVRHGVLSGPRGTTWLSPSNLIDTTLEDWRAADFAMERNVILASLVSAYINDGWTPDEASLKSAHVRTDRLDARRREQAAGIARGMVSNAIRGSDGSVSWIAPTLDQTGWSVQPIGSDMYAGVSGVALFCAAYLREARAGRADAVDGLERLLSGCLYTLALAEKRTAETLNNPSYKVRLPPPGGYIGLGSQIWAYLTLADWGMDGGEGLSRAGGLADRLMASAVASEVTDLLIGGAGAIPPLLMLHRATRDTRYLNSACEIGDHLLTRATTRDGTTFWAGEQTPNGLGGFAHGATGIGWALTKLAIAAGRDDYRAAADAAFAFEQTLFREPERSWVDLRVEDGTTCGVAWCHGATGIGLAHADLDPTLSKHETREIVRHAAAWSWSNGLGWNHTACHGDLGTWEIVDTAIHHGVGPAALDRDRLLGTVLSSLEDFKPTSGFARAAFVPGLLPGLGGVGYQLLRAHPDCDLPSILTMGGQPP